jgi:putative membrane protein
MNERPPNRRPATFRLNDPGVVMLDADDPARQAQDGLPPHLRGKVRITPETEPALPVLLEEPSVVPRKGIRWAATFWSAAGGLVTLALGLWVTHLVEGLFAQSALLGGIGLVLAAIAAVALAVIVGREAISLSRMAMIEKLHLRALAVITSDDRAEARAIIQELLKLEQQNPQLARARAAVTKHIDDIIDGADLIKLAERELLTPLDKEARALVSTAAQRVSVVTAISPRALVDVLFVLVVSVRMVRQLARLYGGRPGAIGMLRLLRQVVVHLAITGGVGIGDSMVSQVLGHGIASKLSAKLGEGVLNGMLTARLGLAAIDLTRPLPFTALPRPALSDLAKNLVRKRDAEL